MASSVDFKTTSSEINWQGGRIKRLEREPIPEDESLQLKDCRRIYFLMLLFKVSLGANESKRFRNRPIIRPARTISFVDQTCKIKTDRAFISYCRLFTIYGEESSFSISDGKDERVADRTWLQFNNKMFQPIFYSTYKDVFDATLTFTLPPLIASDLYFKCQSESDKIKILSNIFSYIVNTYTSYDDRQNIKKLGFNSVDLVTKEIPFGTCIKDALEQCHAKLTESSELMPASSYSSIIPKHVPRIKRQRVQRLKYDQQAAVSICMRLHFFSQLFSGMLNKEHAFMFTEETWYRLKEKQNQQKLVSLLSLKDNVCEVNGDIDFMIYQRKRTEGFISDDPAQEKLKLVTWLTESPDLFQPVVCDIITKAEMKVKFQIPPTAAKETLSEIGYIFRLILKMYIHHTELERIDLKGFRLKERVRTNYIPFDLCLNPE